MGFFDGYNVSTSGMSAQRTRINVVSANIQMQKQLILKRVDHIKSNKLFLKMFY